jgi:two-component system cell cycle sensor histidine kinase/response regulator CckA
MLPTKKAVPTVLMVVDDEPQVLDVERHILEGAGYQVLHSTSALDAIARLAEGPPLDLLIADLDMPELGGDEMVRRIRATRPNLKVLFVTGHADLLMETPRRWEGEAFLEKPFTEEGLREAVSLLLSRS